MKTVSVFLTYEFSGDAEISDELHTALESNTPLSDALQTELEDVLNEFECDWESSYRKKAELETEDLNTNLVTIEY